MAIVDVVALVTARVVEVVETIGLVPDEVDPVKVVEAIGVVVIVES